MPNQIGLNIFPGSQPDRKILNGIDLQTIFYEYQNKNHNINTSFISQGLWPSVLTKLVLILLFFILISAESCL